MQATPCESRGLSVAAVVPTVDCCGSHRWWLLTVTAVVHCCCLMSSTTAVEAVVVAGLSGDADEFVSTDTAACLLIASVEAVMLLVNLQLATTSTVDGFQPVIEVACTVVIESRCMQASTVVDIYVIIMFQVYVVRHYNQLEQRMEYFQYSDSKLSKNID